ncbi:ROK family protein [Enterococcus sp. MJM12]|uniref:ROK family protein n=1 Tax=Candidatus Enterococcus myersii TaxID=2815322 RepID=A0ABS3H8N2_9ENTE|nr:MULTISPECIES: ROK family protein [Enterococcus]MBO0449799.1 ROK family protein [Enterococcus sp. MJM12]MCD1023744.1 ROK family protein [Enterococcus sp. SMC-9]WHA08487.1 ROK family protein [Enterococcus montenegrensis]
MKYAIGIDIGGTKVAGGLVDELGNVTHITRLLSSASDREGMFAVVCRVIEQVLVDSKLSPHEVCVGLGVPGLVDRKAGVAVFQNNLAWENFPVVARLREAFPAVGNIVIDNDVYQATRAEWNYAGLKNEELLVYVTISTGLSCAIMTRGDFIRGNGFAGELGLIPLKKRNGQMYSVEQSAAGPALAEQGKEAYNDGTVTPEEIFRRYRLGEPLAKDLVEAWGKDVSQAIYTIVSLLDPQKIVFGGSVMTLNPDLLPLIKTKLGEWIVPAQSHSISTLAISPYPNTGGIIGAGLHALQ